MSDISTANLIARMRAMPLGAIWLNDAKEGEAVHLLHIYRVAERLADALEAVTVPTETEKNAMVNAWYAQASRWHEEGITSPATDAAWCAGWEAHAAARPVRRAVT